MYTLYYSPGAASMAPHGLLEELGVSYTAQRVSVAEDEHKQPAYLSINPQGKIPALRLDNGDVLTESAGLCLFLADRHSEANLAPGQNDRDRGAYIQWLFYFSNTVQPAALRYYYAERYTLTTPDSDGVKQSAAQEIKRCWTSVEQHLAKHGPYLLGNRFTAADIFCHMLASWQAEEAGFYDPFPHVKKLADLVSARPAIQRVAKLNS